MSIALIAGASGVVGGKLIRTLLSDKTYNKVISIGRKKLDLVDPKLEQIILSFEELDVLNINVDVVFCCLGTTIKKAGSKEAFKKVDYEYPKHLAQFALKAGASGYHIITAMGANANSNFFYNKIKGEIEDELRQLDFDQLHIYRPSLLLDPRPESRITESVSKVIMKSLGFIFIGGLKNYKAIRANQVVKYIMNKTEIKESGIFVHLSGEMQ